MSAEAADREAATSSRPCTPPQTSWFEFLLEEALLEQHLQKPSPGACGAAPLAANFPRLWARPGVAPQLLTGAGEETFARFPAGPFSRRCGLQARPVPPPSRGLLLALPAAHWRRLPPALLCLALAPSLAFRFPPGRRRGALLPRRW